MSLDSLAKYYGILDSFVDAHGATQITPRKTTLALLAAMGERATDDDDARVALAKLQRREAARCIPPVYVHHQGADAPGAEAPGAEALALEVDLSAHRPQAWRIELEDGAILLGSLEASGTSRCRVRPEQTLPYGYHALILEPGEYRCSLIVTPGQCWLPEGVETGRKFWGVAAQLYLLRSPNNWGIGDYGDLGCLVRAFAARGADVVGLNPLHAMFEDDPEQASPYSPASRLLLNVLNIDVMAVAASMDCPATQARLASGAFQEALARCRNADLVDYSGVAALKLPVLRELFECADRDAQQWQSFVAFRAAAGEAFERSCLFLALRSCFARESRDTADWHRWPTEYRSADSAGTRKFAIEHAEDVTFQAWQQFIADQQLESCREAGAGMAIGLYRDLAVGAALDGAETWSNATAVIDSVHVGAPPDIHNPQGQDWGLPPFDPRALRSEGYRSFIELVRANMRHAGGLRIDHVMALQQLYWIPSGHPPSAGGYVRYPIDDLVGILALESHRHRCLVVGEDLGTVPAGFRERMERGKILSYRVLFFEKTAAGFIPPDDYPRLALAVAGSHDMPTLRAWWLGRDLVLKRRLGLYPKESQATDAATDRDLDREALAGLLREPGFVAGTSLDVEAFVDAAHGMLAQCRAAVTVLQIDDLTSEIDPVNVPSTSHEHPNWRRRLSMNLEQLLDNPQFGSTLQSVRMRRRAASDSIG